jgi:DNA-binding NtrC family response regulator
MKNYSAYPSQSPQSSENAFSRSVKSDNYPKQNVVTSHNGKIDEGSVRLKRIQGLAKLLMSISSGELVIPEESKDQSIQAELKHFNLEIRVRQFEIGLIVQALIKTGGKQNRAANLLGVKKSTLNAKIKRYHIPIDELSTVNLQNYLAMGEFQDANL